jgi:hypothetical protein
MGETKMRTDTKTFRTNVLAQVKALGINSNRSKIVAKRLASAISNGSYGSYGSAGFEGRKSFDTLELKLDFMFSGGQAVDAIIDGEYAMAASTDDQRLVDVEATAEQKAMRPAFDMAIQDLYGSLSDACQAWDDVHGHPETFALADVRRADVDLVPEVVAARAAYDALVQRSVAMNRYAHATWTDPIAFDSYSDCWKDETGSRPRGYANREQILAYFAREQAGAANDDDKSAQAA